MSFKSLMLLLGLASTPAVLAAPKNYTITSPDGTLQGTVAVDTEIRIALSADGKALLNPSPVAMTLAGGEVLGRDPRVVKAKKRSADETFDAHFYKKAQVRDHYNELALAFRGDYSLVVRLYDDGMAYRFETRKKGEITVENEQAEFNFPADFTTYAPYVYRTELRDFEWQFSNAFENTYVKLPMTQLDVRRLMFLPLLIEGPEGSKLLLTESDLRDYPGLFLASSAEKPQLRGVLATYPRTVANPSGYNNQQQIVLDREDYIARTEGTRTFPWRVMVYAREDSDLLASDMTYRLAPPSKIDDTSWIRPGKVAWDWWHALNLYGVDFEAGINTRTYKYYIDFAAQNGLEYILIDDGWSVNGPADLMQVVPEMDLEELVAYGRERGVGILLWAGHAPFENGMEQAVKHYAEMGIKGFKVDYMNRDDQQVVRFLHRAAELCAQYHLILDFHGIFKPAGMNRTWPNVLNFEGVFGLENMKWSPTTTDMVTYDVTMPFIRMAAGPVDYTQGAMRNATKENYRPVHGEPMSQGTRSRQVAEYVVFESPLNMLSDSPSNYLRERETLDFIAAIPTVWDETVPLKNAVGEYISVARRAGDVWYVGALTGWDARELELDLSFLGAGPWQVESFSDGVNAARVARDYRRECSTLPSDGKLRVKLAPGGGFAARITR